MVRQSFLFLGIAPVPVITLVSDYIGKRIAFSVIPGMAYDHLSSPLHRLFRAGGVALPFTYIL